MSFPFYLFFFFSLPSRFVALLPLSVHYIWYSNRYFVVKSWYDVIGLGRGGGGCCTTWKEGRKKINKSFSFPSPPTRDKYTAYMGGKKNRCDFAFDFSSEAPPPRPSLPSRWQDRRHEPRNIPTVKSSFFFLSFVCDLFFFRTRRLRVKENVFQIWLPSSRVIAWKLLFDVGWGGERM